MNKPVKNNYHIYLIVLIGIVTFLLITRLNNPYGEPIEYSYSTLVSDLQHNPENINKIEISTDSDVVDFGQAKIYFSTNPNDYAIVNIPSIISFTNLIDNTIGEGKVIEVTSLSVDKTGQILSSIIPIILMVVVLFAIFFVIQQAQGGGGGNKAMSFGKSKAKLIVPGKNKTKFEDVAGLKEEKLELEEVADFLKSPKKYVDLGARIPKGILLVGPPGTGKTLLAKAVAGEANAPFFSISGSDFVEMFVGVGASRVRDLFEQAKKNAPCLIFIDEIDAVGRRRGAGLGGGHDEREQTLNQLLVEMDGFAVNEGIIVLAATNRADILDPALLRPGRFDRQVKVGPPDVIGREEILKVHAKNKKMNADINLKVVAQITAGFTGADLENLLNEAALISAREDAKDITMEAIKQAFIKLGIGTEKKSRAISKKEKLITAYHEAGHAILFEVLETLDPVHIVSVIPTGFAGGYTMPIPSNDRMYQSKTYMTETIMSLLGGRVAEKLMMNDITTGASNDIERATKIARAMVTRFGMSDEIGPIQFGQDESEVFLGRDISHSKNYSESSAMKIDAEVKAIIDMCHNRTLEILETHKDVLENSAQLLVEKERITGHEFRKLFPTGILKEKETLESINELLSDEFHEV